MRYAVGDINVCKLIRIIECAVAYVLESLRQIDILQVLTGVEAVIFDPCYRIGEYDGCDDIAVAEALLGDGIDRAVVREYYISEAVAAVRQIERSVYEALPEVLVPVSWVSPL